MFAGQGDTHVFKSDGEEYSILVASYTANASASVATFNISVTDDNCYKLSASAPSTDTCSYNDDVEFFTAVFIPQTQPIAPCPDNMECKQVFNGSFTAATLFSDDGTFTAAFEGAIPAMTTACGGGPLDSNGVLTFSNATATGPKTIIFALASNLVNKGIGQFTVCWRAVSSLTGLPSPDCSRPAARTPLGRASSSRSRTRRTSGSSGSWLLQAPSTLRGTRSRVSDRRQHHVRQGQRAQRWARCRVSPRSSSAPDPSTEAAMNRRITAAETTLPLPS